MEILTPDPRFPDVKLVRMKKHGDGRGFFSETYTQRGLAAGGIATIFVQDNHVLSVGAGTVRGLHFQTEPFAQAKLVRVVRGAIFDAVVDIRRGSPTFGKFFSVTLTEENWTQLFVPAGFAHGLITLQPNTEVIYKVSNYYAPEHDKGLLWNDPDLGIPWPMPPGEALLSPKDAVQPRLKDLPAYFTFARDAAER